MALRLQRRAAFAPRLLGESPKALMSPCKSASFPTYRASASTKPAGTCWARVHFNCPSAITGFVAKSTTAGTSPASPRSNRGEYSRLAGPLVRYRKDYHYLTVVLLADLPSALTRHPPNTYSWAEAACVAALPAASGLGHANDGPRLTSLIRSVAIVHPQAQLGFPTQ